jgi:hypothetical protein
LDEITKLRYHSKLPSSVEGVHRNALISSFRTCKGASYVPKIVHHSIRWNKGDPMLLPVESELCWKIINKAEPFIQNKVKTNFVPAQGSTPVQTSKRKRIDDILDHKEKASKKVNKVGAFSSHAKT